MMIGFHTRRRACEVLGKFLGDQLARKGGRTRSLAVLVNLRSRERQVQKLGKQDNELDILVIGGGATGCGTALDAASRGLKVALVEKGDFASETSSRSTKLIWAGIRYIGTAVSALLSRETLKHPVKSWGNFVGEFKMVLGAHKERRFMMKTQPHLTQWQPIAVPIDRWITWPPPMGHPLFSIAGMVLPFVFKFYDSLSSFSCPPSYILSKRLTKERFPHLDSDRIKYTQVFYEGMHNDARTCVAIAMTAAEYGATVANYVEVVALERNDQLDAARVTGVLAQDKISGEMLRISAKAIIFAGGPFTDSLRKLEDPDCKPAVSGAAGTHIVLPGYFSSHGMGLLDINTSDGRFLFFLPWQGSTIVGTTDRKGTPSTSPAPPEEEIEWILNEVKKYLSPDLRVRRSDVLSAWRGWRPLANDPHAPPGAAPSRDHTISTNPESKITFITGGKWTTYREMAEDVVNRVIKEKNLKGARPCVTQTIPLIGGENFSPSLYVQLIQKYNISEETAKHLMKTYGSRAREVVKLTMPTNKRWPRFGVPLAEGYPYLENEVEYAIIEYARTVKDVLTLRTRLAFLNSEAAKHAAPRVAALMGKKLGWTQQEQSRQLQEALEYLDSFGGPYPKGGADWERKDLESLFQQLDWDGSGFIDQVELLNAANTLGFHVGTKDELEDLFSKLPGAESGRVFKDDFLRFFEENVEKEAVLKRMSNELKLSIEKLEENAQGVMFG